LNCGISKRVRHILMKSTKGRLAAATPPYRMASGFPGDPVAPFNFNGAKKNANS